MTVAASIQGLTIATRSGAAILNGIDLDLHDGEVIGLTGRSGSGKSTLLHTLVGHVSPGQVIRGGSVSVTGLDPFSSTGRRLRGIITGYVPQEPASALNPAHTVRWHLDEAARRAHPNASTALVQSLILEAAHAAELDSALLNRRSWRLSGGQAQRAILASLHVTRPRLVLLDEPTSGLDPDTARKVARRFTRLPWTPAVLLISHSDELINTIADRRLTLRDGALTPHNAQPSPKRPIATTHRARSSAAVVRVNGLSIRRAGRVLVDSASFDLEEGHLLSLQGRSGAGKTSIGRTLVGLDSPHAGALSVNGKPVPWAGTRRSVAQKPLVAMILQDSRSALNPVETVAVTLERASRIARRRGIITPDASQLLEQLALDPSTLARRPGELSGGQRQRVALARALASAPALLVCDEVTASLDSATEQLVLDTLDQVRFNTGLPVLLITHSDTVARRADTNLTLIEGNLV